MDDGGYLLLFEKILIVRFFCEEKKKRQIHQMALSFSMQCVGLARRIVKKRMCFRVRRWRRSTFPKTRTKENKREREREREREKSRDIHT